MIIPKIFKGSVYTKRGLIINDCYVVCSAGPVSTISYVGGKEKLPKDVDPDLAEIIPEEMVLAPGYIDLHIHGVNGSDVMDATGDSLTAICKALPKEGTTAWLPTTMTESTERIVNAIQNIKNKRALQDKEINDESFIAGIHLEGPWLDPNFAGAQNSINLTNPDVDMYNDLQDKSGGLIKIITISPILSGAKEFISQVSKRNVIISLGHTGGDYNDGDIAINNGAKQATHFTNRTPKNVLKSQKIGGDKTISDALLERSEVSIEVIPDGVHISFDDLTDLIKRKTPEKVILITDSMRAKGLRTNGECYDLGGQQIIVRGNEARIPGKESKNPQSITEKEFKKLPLAGSVLKMSDGVSNIVRHCKFPIETAIMMASENPAKQLGFSNMGTIESGKIANFVIVDKTTGKLKRTLINGVEVYSAH